MQMSDEDKLEEFKQNLNNDSYAKLKAEILTELRVRNYRNQKKIRKIINKKQKN